MEEVQVELMPGIRMTYWPSEDLFELDQDISYIINGRRWTVPAGFKTDGFTARSWLRPFVPRMHGKYFVAAVLHDWMYVNAVNNKRFADRTFYDLLRELGMPWYKAKAYHIAVSIGGKGNY